MSNDIGDWFQSIPPISKWWFSLSIALPILGRFGLLSFQTMALDYRFLFHKFHIWRPFTALFYYPLTPQTGFHYLINLYFLYSYSTRLETGIFAGRPADYLFMLIFNWFCLVLIALGMGFPLLMDPMIMSVLYVWCQINKDDIVQFWFGTRFPAKYLPWVLAAFNLILGGGGVMELIGIVVGHLYFFLQFQYPTEFGGSQFLTTPSFMYKYLPSTSQGVSGFGAPPASRRVDDRGPGDGGHRWGQGNALGGGGGWFG